MTEDFSNIESEEMPEFLDMANELPKDSQIYINHSLDIPRYIKFMLNSLGISQNTIAQQLGKTEPEVSKWLSGKNNFTLRTISKLESVLPINIINPEITALVKRLKGVTVMDMPTLSFNSDTKLNVFILNHSVCKVETKDSLVQSASIKSNSEINITDLVY